MSMLLTIVPFILLIAGGGEEKVVDWSKFLEKDGLQYEVNSETPFTGKMVKYWPSGQQKEEAEYRDGKLHGKGTFWNENGQKIAEFEFRDGKPHGKWLIWNDNGQKEGEAEFRDGILISAKCWDNNGNTVPCPQEDANNIE